MITKEITIKWCIEDVQELDEILTDQQCSDVLELAKRKHDAEVGINWDVLQCHIDTIKEQTK
jgi:hypothetical protein